MSAILFEMQAVQTVGAHDLVLLSYGNNQWDWTSIETFLWTRTILWHFSVRGLEVRFRENLVNKDNSITVLTSRLLSTK